MVEEQSNQTQCQRIIEYIVKHRSITSAEAMDEFGCYRLASRIHDLKKRGYPINSFMVHGKNRYGKGTKYKMYTLDEDWEGWQQVNGITG